MAELTGQLLGNRYRVERFLGRGGMADVYQVFDQQRAVSLAMKVLHDDLAEDMLFLEHFEREARALEILQHPNIVRFYGLNQAGNFAFILMDFIDGLTLRKEIYLHKEGITPERILEILQPVCAALFYAHQMGLVHCDLKPGNIMIHRNRTVYLTDFGIARMTEASTDSLSGVGTPAYMAPEQLDANDSSPAVDIYALGVILFEMLTGGQRPFTGDAAQTTGSVTKKILWEKIHLPPPSPRKYNQHIPPAVEAVVMRCLEVEPGRRFANALDLLHALEAAVRGEEMADGDQTNTAFANKPAEVPKAAWSKQANEHHLKPAAPRAPPLFQWAEDSFKHLPGGATAGWIAAGMGALVLVSILLAVLVNPVHAPTPTATAALVAGASMGVDGNRTATPEASSTPAPTELATSAPVLLPPTHTPIPQPTSLGGSQWIAFASDRSGTLQVWIMDANSPDRRRQLTNEPGGACQPAWSPDGTQLAFTTPCYGASIFYPTSMIKIVNLADLTVTPLPLTGSCAFDPAWSPDGSNLAYTTIVGTNAEIRAYNFADKTITTLTNRGSKSAQPAWAPDGVHLAFVTSDQRHKEALWLMGSAGDSQEVFSESAGFADPAFSPDGSLVLVSKNRGNNQMDLVLFDRYDPTRGDQPLITAGYQSMQGSFSPDGKWVVFWSDLSKNKSEILAVRIADKEIRQMTNNLLRDFQPAWSPR